MPDISELEKLSKSIKRRFLSMYFDAGAGHVGSSLSCAELLTCIRFSWMREQDHFILSKGHAAAGLYSMLAEAGDINESDIATFYKNGTYLPAHPPVNKLKRVPFATGSLGHGLSLAAGLALASKLKGEGKQVFCLTSDGELNEGSTWEAALFIAAHHLHQLTWIIDRNRLQGFGNTEDVMPLDPLEDKLRAFGFEVVQLNGHDFNELIAAKSNSSGNKPMAVIAETRKGKGWEKWEAQLACHYLPMKEEEYLQLIAQLDN